MDDDFNIFGFASDPYSSEQAGLYSEGITASTLPSVESLTGDNNSPPVQTSVSTSNASDQQKLGSGGSFFSQLGQEILALPGQAKALGTAVGTAKASVAQAQANYSAAQSAASTQNSLATWWLYASTTDKLMVALAVGALVVAIAKD